MKMRLPPALARAWDARSVAGRAGWIVLAAIAVIVAVMALVAAPLSEAIARRKAEVAELRLVLDVARMRTAENATLARAAAATAGAQDWRAAIDRIVAREGLRAVPAAAGANEGTVRIVIGDAPFDALVRALDALAREDGVRVAEAMLAARVESGTVRAELALTR